MRNEATELEIIMREALISNNLFFDEQVYTKRDHGGIYIFDFVVYGDYAKIVVECDGPHHYKADRYYLDSVRDLWSVRNGFQDVLRFSKSELRRNIAGCISMIKKSLSELDKTLSHDKSRFKRIQDEKSRIKSRKNSHFYDGEKPYSKYAGRKGTLQDNKVRYSAIPTRRPIYKLEVEHSEYSSFQKSDSLKEYTIESQLQPAELKAFEELKQLPNHRSDYFGILSKMQIKIISLFIEG